MLAYLLLLIANVCIAAPARFGEPYLISSSDSSLLRLKRSISQDPSCPSEYLCEQSACPANVICPPGEQCLNFEGTFGCIPNTGLSFCAVNPTTLQAVGCNQGVCCHGNCYIAGTVCCDIPSVQCSVGTLCNACPSGQTCTANGCSGGTTSAAPSSTTNKPISITIQPSTTVTTQPSTTVTTKPSTTMTTQPSTTVTTTSSTSVTSAAPTIVPTAGSFTSLGCFEDNGANRVLVNGSSTDYSATGMTVEKCAALASGWQYAGVEYYGECYWGDLTTYRNSENTADCNSFCNGDPTEICGGPGRLVLYQDQNWVLLTDAEYAAKLQTFLALLQQLKTLYAKWYQDLQAYYKAVQAAAQNKRKRQTLTLSQQGITLNVEMANIQALFKPKTIKLNLLTFDYYLKIKINQAQKNAEAAADQQKTMDQVAADLLDQLAPTNLKPVQIIPDGTIPTTVEVAAVEQVVTAGAEVAATLGEAAVVVVDGTIVAVATGLFATLAAVLAHFIPAPGGGGGGNDHPTTTSKPSSSSSTTCSPTMSPTAMVILMTEDATDAQYKELTSSLPAAAYQGEIIYEIVNFRVLIANVNDCDIKKLWENPIVETMGLEGPFVVDDEADGTFDPNIKREIVKLAPQQFEDVTGNASISTAKLSERALVPGVNLKTQANSPWHLRLLSGLSFQVGVAAGALFYDFPGYLFADRSPATATNSPVSAVNLYILDTGIRATHQDFAGRTVTAMDARTGFNNPNDEQAHGTHMCSVSAGNYAGVAKAANIFSIKKDSFVSTLSRGFGIILNDVVTNHFEGRAVINLSFGVDPALLYAHDLPQPGAGPPIDLIGAYLPRLYAKGIVVVCSAGNGGRIIHPTSALNYMTPRKHGGTNTPLIVVGASETDAAESKWVGSQYIDPNNEGILTIYANGVNVLSAWFQGDDEYSPATGTSEATAITSGLIAYYLANNLLQSRFSLLGVGNVAANVKSYIQQISNTQKFSVTRTVPGPGGPGDGVFTDLTPRLANGESIPCAVQSTANGQPVLAAQPVFQLPPQIQQIIPAAYPTTPVSQGSAIVPQAQLPPCVPQP